MKVSMTCVVQCKKTVQKLFIAFELSAPHSVPLEFRPHTLLRSALGDRLVEFGNQPRRNGDAAQDHIPFTGLAAFVTIDIYDSTHLSIPHFPIPRCLIDLFAGLLSTTSSSPISRDLAKIAL